MTDKSFMKPSQRFKQFQSDFQDSLLTADRSHLEPVPPYTPVEYVYSGDRDQRYQSPYRVTPHYWYWRIVQHDKTLHDLRERCKAREAERRAKLAEVGIQFVFYPELNAFIGVPASKASAVHSVVFDSQHSQLDETKSFFCVTGRGAAGSTKKHFLEENRQSLPVKTTQNEKKVAFLASAQESPEMAEKFGFCNTQTIAGVPAKIAINRTDFLAR